MHLKMNEDRAAPQSNGHAAPGASGTSGHLAIRLIIAAWAVESALGLASGLIRPHSESLMAFTAIPGAVLGIGWLVFAVVWVLPQLRPVLSEWVGFPLYVGNSITQGDIWSAGDKATRRQRLIVNLLEFSALLFVILGPLFLYLLPILLLSPETG